MLYIIWDHVDQQFALEVTCQRLRKKIFSSQPFINKETGLNPIYITLFKQTSIVWLIYSNEKCQLKYWQNHFTWSGESEYIVCFAKYFDIAKIWAITDFAKFKKAFLKSRNLNISRNNLYIRNFQITCFKWYITCLCPMSLIFSELLKMA